MKYIKVLLVMITLMLVLGGCSKEEEQEIVLNEQGSAPTVQPTVSSEQQVEESEKPTQTPKPETEQTQKPTKEPSNSTVQLLEAKNSSKYTVVIDAGHQKQGNSDHEPIGPGASETKPKVSSGTTGVASGVPEYVVTLQVSKKVESILKSKGYNVIMCRDTHEVDMSNSERAQIANNANADAFIRIHCNGAENSSAKGALTMCQTKKNKYCGKLHSKSRELSQRLVDRICEATGAQNKGILESDTMSGINWCSVPVSIIEMGFMSNKEEDLLLVDDGYQDKMAVGICNGVIEYLNKK